MSELKERNQIEEKYKWNLKDLFQSDQVWEKEFSSIKALLPQLSAFQGTLKEKQQLKKLFELEHSIMPKLEKLFVYAKMSRDQDNGNDRYVSMCDRAYALLTACDTETAYIVPELNRLDDDILLSWSNDHMFEDRSIFLKEIVRNKSHVLTEGEERLLALSGEMANSYDTIFTMLDDVDMKFTPVTLSDGTQTELSHGRYGLFLQDKDRSVRRQAYESMYEAHIQNINTLAALYASSVKKDVFYARARKFSSVIEGELFSGNIPLSVYDGLIEAIHGRTAGTAPLCSLKKKAVIPERDEDVRYVRTDCGSKYHSLQL